MSVIRCCSSKATDSEGNAPPSKPTAVSYIFQLSPPSLSFLAHKTQETRVFLDPDQSSHFSLLWFQIYQRLDRHRASRLPTSAFQRFLFLRSGKGKKRGAKYPAANMKGLELAPWPNILHFEAGHDYFIQWKNVDWLILRRPESGKCLVRHRIYRTRAHRMHFEVLHWRKKGKRKDRRKYPSSVRSLLLLFVLWSIYNAHRERALKKYI